MNVFLICFVNGLFKEYRWLLNEYDEDRHLIHTTEQEHLEQLAKYYVDNGLDDLYDGINKRGGIYDVNY